MKKVCANCQYYREKSWCSNSKSPHFRYGSPHAPFEEVYMFSNGTCDHFAQRDQKAPWWMRLLNWVFHR